MVQLNIFQPMQNQIVKTGQLFSVSGEATDRGGSEPILIDSVTVTVDDQPLINAPLTTIPDPTQTRRDFQVMVQVSTPGPHTIVVTATNDNGLSTTKNVIVGAPWDSQTGPFLNRVTITFNTHDDADDDKDSDTILHVFVKNRSSTSSTPEDARDQVSNSLAFQSCDEAYWEKNPYLAKAENLAPDTRFDTPSSQQFDIPLRSAPIPRDEIELPVVNIHILPNNEDRWIFSYTIQFFFDDGNSFDYSSDTDGVTGIILDQDNRDYSGICVENPFKSISLPTKPHMACTLTRVTLTFHTHDDNKDGNTQLNVHITNRINSFNSTDIAIGLDILNGTEFKDSSTWTVDSSTGLPLASTSIQLEDIVLPVVSIDIVPMGGLGNDRWIFDYQVTFEFTDKIRPDPFYKGRIFRSQTYGVILDQDNRKHIGVYQGPAFPNIMPPGRPANLASAPDQSEVKTKSISLSFLNSKLNEFINNRQGADSFQDPPIVRLRLDNSGIFGNTIPESYANLQSIVANPTLSSSGFNLDVTYSSSTTKLSQLTGGFGIFAGIIPYYLVNLQSKELKLTLDSSNIETPLTLMVTFDTGQGRGIAGLQVDILYLRILLSLAAVDPSISFVDVLSWVHSVDSDHLKDYLDFHIEPSHETIENYVNGKIFSMLTTPDPFDGLTLRDGLNEKINSWLVGGLHGLNNASGISVLDSKIEGDSLNITYTGPVSTFAPLKPTDWPSGIDFSPGNLANIEHIVVLTMENRSFDSMLGYLSLPLDKGGMGREDVDGLNVDADGQVSTSNLFNGTVYRSFAFAPQDTVFGPDPPHGYEPTHKAINGDLVDGTGGKMDSFVQSFAEEHGPMVAYRIMGYYNAVNVPVYDALARDFAICNRWFASHPGPTFCNRFYELTGMLNMNPDGFWEFENSSPLRPVFTKTIFDYLDDNIVSWRYFEDHYCFLRFFQGHTFDQANIVKFDDPDHPESGFENLARQGALPSVSFIDPHFIELPPDANSDEPPSDVQKGQQLVEKVVNAVVSGANWDKTLLIITYDEHGGFYDHIPPPAATKVSPESLDTYGVRVPTIVISPWVKGGTVFGHDRAIGGPGGGGHPIPALYFDHTSILKTIARTFMSMNPPYLGPRYAAANDLSSVIGNESRPGPFRPFIPYNFLYGASNKRLEVQNGDTSQGTALVQSDLDNRPPDVAKQQQFSFEDAGNGYWYIRTHTGSLYVTADDSLEIKQDVKYPTDGSATATNNPDRQRWMFTTGISPLDLNNCTISNAAFPGKVLQPADGSNNSGVLVVLGNPASPGIPPNPWQVTSPLLPGGV